VKDIDYKDIDVSALTVEDALADENWHKSPYDFFEYVTIDKAVLDTFIDMDDDEIVEIMRIVRSYCMDGLEPDYSKIKSSTVKLSVRSIMQAHSKRMNEEYIRRYRKFVGGKQGANKRNTK